MTAAAFRIVAGLLAAGPVLAQEALVWTYTRSVQPDPFDTVLALSYAIPEADAVQAVARCEIGNRGPYVALDLFYDVAGRGEGDAADVILTTPDGVRHRPIGAFTGVAAEHGISGLGLAIETDDPALTAFAEGGTLYYEVVGQSSVPLPLDGIGDKMARFVSDCARLDTLFDEGTRGGAQGGAPPAGAAEAGPDPRCAMAGNLRSVDGPDLMTLTLRNDTEGYRGINWIDFDGVRRDYGGLNPDATVSFDTREGHVWEFTDGPGNCLEIVVSDGDAIFVALTRDNVFSGHE